MVRKDRKKAKQEASKEKKDQNAENVLDSEAGEIIDMNEAIKLLDTTRSTFYRWVREGQIKGMKVGRQWRFYREDIDRFMKGEEPRIDLPANINPLIETLRTYAEQLDEEDLPLSIDSGPPVLEAVNLMILIADRMNASDIHLAPHLREAEMEAVGMLRYRVDGVLHTVAEIDIRLMSAIIARWKIMAKCDVHERQKPQDGRIPVRFPDTDRQMDMRVTFLPSGLGESFTVRIIDRSSQSLLELDALGFSPNDEEKISRWLKAPWGMIIVSGPTGSGKTTVLYSCLKHVARPEVKILTAENPVEFFLPWAVQVSVRPEDGFTFADALRSILRSDPDIIMVGEIRDVETLDIAQQCALTGHLVIATMHVAGSVSVLRRMLELGSPLYMVGESTKLVTSQRLVRKLCAECSIEQELSAELLEHAQKTVQIGGLDWDSLPKNFHKQIGCSNCKGTGYRGRTLIAETLEVTPEIMAALRRDASNEEVREIAVKQGMTTMAADGIRKAAIGITSMTEAMRVAPV